MPNYTPQQILYVLADRVAMSVAVGVRFLSADDQATFRGLAPPETGWTLGLVLAGWFVTRNSDLDGPQAAGLLQPYGVDEFYSALDGYAHLLSPFLDRARYADTPAKLSAAGQSFAYAAGQIGIGFLRMVVSSPAFVSLRVLVTKFPPPAGFRERYRLELGAPSPSYPVSASSLPPLPGQIAMNPPPRDVPDEEIDDEEDDDSDDTGDESGTSVPAPKLSDADACAAHLHALGVPPAEIARLCAGPKGRSA